MLWLLRSLAYSMSIYFCVHTSYIIFDVHVQPSQLSILAACMPFPSFHLFYSPHIRLPVTTSFPKWSIQLHIKPVNAIGNTFHPKALPPFLFAKAVENLRERFLDMALGWHSEHLCWWVKIQFGFLMVSWFICPDFAGKPHVTLTFSLCFIWYLIWVAIQTGTILMKSRNSNEHATMSAIILCFQLLRKSDGVEPTHLSLFLSLSGQHYFWDTGKEMRVDHIYIDVIDVHQKGDSVHFTWLHVSKNPPCLRWRCRNFSERLLVSKWMESCHCWKTLRQEWFLGSGPGVKLFVFFSQVKVNRIGSQWEYNTGETEATYGFSGWNFTRNASNLRIFFWFWRRISTHESQGIAGVFRHGFTMCKNREKNLNCQNY